MFGYFKNENNTVVISNKIFSQVLYNYFSSLLENNYTCLRISSNAELEELAHCNSVFLNENKQFNCLSCDKGYTSLEENGKIKCFSYNSFICPCRYNKKTSFS